MEDEHLRVAANTATEALERWRGVFADDVIAFMHRELCQALATEPLGRHLVSRVRQRGNVHESGDVAQDGTFDDNLAEANARISKKAAGGDE